MSRKLLLWQIIWLISGAISTPVLLTAQGKRFADQKMAMKVFADLLKIPSSSPEVSVTVSNTKEEEGFITEDLSWESLDNQHPTAFVIRPVDAGKRLPAVVCLHGTGGSRESMCTQKFGIGEWARPGDKTSHPRLLGWAQELSRRGYLILALTQRGLDSRTPDTDDQAKDLLVRGRTIMGAIVYEIRQAVTYLQSRSDVNPDKIGMTGLSFGGITTFYTWLVDDRVTAAAPICGGVGSVDVFLQLGSRGYHGYYWWIPDMLTKGDQGDFAAAMAPRPFMLWAPRNDIGMPNEGVDRFLEVVQPAYARSQAKEALVVHRPPGNMLSHWKRSTRWSLFLIGSSNRNEGRTMFLTLTLVCRTILSISVFLLGTRPLWSQQIFKEQRVPPTDFAVMAWGPASPDPQQLQWMKEAGLNIAGFGMVKDLAAYEKAGIQVFVSDPRANGYDFEKPLSEADVRRNLGSLSKEVGTSPAVLGFMLRDEPHARAMPMLGMVARLIQELMPGKWPYVNLFPVRVSADRMGVSNYNDYVRMLVDTIHQPFLSYDNYSLLEGEMLDYFYTNLEVVRRLSLETKTPFWNCVLSNAHFNYMENSDSTYNLQAYATMAHGGRGIQYFSYFTWPLGNYRLGPIDQFGNKTTSWDKLRRINNQIHALAPTLKGLKSTGVYHYPDVPADCRPLVESKLVESVEMTQRYVVPPIQGRFLIGEFQDGQGRPYLMLVNKDLNQSFRFKVNLRKPYQKLTHISPYSGQEEPFGQEMDWIAPGAGHLFRLE